MHSHGTSRQHGHVFKMPPMPVLCCAPQALVLMREHFEEITALCAECQSLIDCHDKIAVLSEVHYNLRKTLQVCCGSSRGTNGEAACWRCCWHGTPHPRAPAWLQDVENIAALPVEAAEAEEMLRDNANLLHVRLLPALAACLPSCGFGFAAVVFPGYGCFHASTLPNKQVYEMLASLEGTSMKAQQALESGTNVNLQEATNLNSYFQKARTQPREEGRLWLEGSLAPMLRCDFNLL